ncbi:hypothetical protein [Candidatus Clostridium radicumherbarum]|uniref:Uncharacterized protein n=1 Tax=Candidatus Clostridium radicumherbarum TaxID=3381662 RepID=A0ABW8TTE7_9CLOT
MLNPNAIEIIEIIILISTLIFYIKNYFIDFKESTNSFKNILFLLLGLVLVVSSALSILYSIDLNGIVMDLASDQYKYSIELLEYLNSQKLQYEHIITVLGIFQGISLSIITILFISIIKEIKEASAKFKSRWDWDNIKKNIL